MFFTMNCYVLSHFFSVNTISNTQAEYAQFKKKNGNARNGFFNLSDLLTSYQHDCESLFT